MVPGGKSGELAVSERIRRSGRERKEPERFGFFEGALSAPAQPETDNSGGDEAPELARSLGAEPRVQAEVPPDKHLITFEPIIDQTKALVLKLRLPKASLQALNYQKFTSPTTNVTISRKRKRRNASSPLSSVLLTLAPSSQSDAKRQRRAVLAPEVINPRPQPWGQPEVWAEDRPTLCEALKYYNAWQGAAYIYQGHVRAMVLDFDEGERAYMGEEVVIARAGGGMGKNNDGKMVQLNDHDSNKKNIAAFYNNVKDDVPVYLIVGNKNVQCPSEPPHRYCVMDAFIITDIWHERAWHEEGKGKMTVKFRLEKIDRFCKSWWAAEDSIFEPTADIATTVKAPRLQCSECKESSTKVFEKGWICLNKTCDSFWTLDGANPPKELAYSQVFLDERITWRDDLPYALQPELIDATVATSKGFSVSEACSRGIVCPECGRCNSRKDWDAWRCETKGCEFVHKLPLDILSAADVADEWSEQFEGPAIPTDIFDEKLVKRTIERHGLYRIHTYELPSGDTITHFLPTGTVNKAPGGPNDLFRALQVVDIGLQRFRMKQSVVPGTRANHFSTNFGLPYAYVVATDSKSFGEAPNEILEVVDRLTWAGKYAAPDTFKPFNELLAIGYLEAQKMGYHDDGEKTLAGMIASLSLGASSTMNFRMKSKFFHGFRGKKLDLYDPNLPVEPGCNEPKVRKSLNQVARTMSREDLTALAKEKFKKIPLHATPVLSLGLRHGSMVVMNGEHMQDIYEHEVIPNNKLRFGLTCRFVKPDMLPADQLWKGELPGNFVGKYDGDLALYEEHEQKKKKTAAEKRAKYMKSSAMRAAENAAEKAIIERDPTVEDAATPAKAAPIVIEDALMAMNGVPVTD